MPLIPARFRKPDPAAVKREEIRKEIAVLAKAMQGIGSGTTGSSAGAMGPTMPGSQFQGGWNNLGNASMAMLQRVTANMARQHNVPVADIEAQLIEQGLTWGPPFPPGRPLDPFFGYRRGPRTRDYTVGENVQLTPRWNRVSFETIKAIYDAYDVAQIVVRHLINDVRSLDYDWVPLDGERDDVSADIDFARKFFAYPDREQPFRAWLAEYLQDVLRYDAGALYVRRTEAGQPYALEVVTGASLIPLIDFYGRVAADRDDNDPPEGIWAGGDTPGFLQIIQGLPWDWLTKDDIIYQPWNPLPESQYGLAPLEAVLLTANTDIRFQQHFLEYFTAGSLPSGFMEAPQDMSDPAMIREYQDTWDALMVGDQEMLRRIRFVPYGSKFTPVKNSDFDAEFPLYLMRRVCAAYGVTPADLGFTETVNKATSEIQIDVQWRVGTLPLVRHVEDVINLIASQKLGLRCKIQFDKGQEIEDQLSMAQLFTQYIENGVYSIDEVRTKLGEPIDRSRPFPRFFANSRVGAIPLIAIESMAGKIDKDTYGPDKSQPLISNPYMPVPGVLPNQGTPELKGVEAASAQTGKDMLEASSGGKPSPEMQALIDAANPPPSGSSQGPEGTTAQPASVSPGQGAGSSPEPSGASQGAAKEYMPQFDDEKVSWLAPNGEKLTGYVQMIGENGDVALADEPGGESMYLIPFQNLDPEDGPWIEVSPNVFESAKKARAAWLLKRDRLAKDGLGGGGNVSGVFTATSGIQGNPLTSGSGDPDDDDEDDETSELYGFNEEWKAAKSVDALLELRRWRENARNRIRKGQSPRQFRSAAIPPDVQALIWSRLEKAESRQEVNQVFADVLSGRPFPVADTGPGQGSAARKGDAPKPEKTKADEDDFSGVVAGGLIVQAADTGRVLMIQRTPDKHDDDAAYARWEWPGGCLDVDDVGVWQGALREWEEETGSTLSEDAEHVGSFLDGDGRYQAYVIRVPSEDGLEFDPQPEEVSSVDWWDPADLTDGQVRDKVQENLEPLQRFLIGGGAVKAGGTLPDGRDYLQGADGKLEGSTPGAGGSDSSSGGSGGSFTPEGFQTESGTKVGSGKNASYNTVAQEAQASDFAKDAITQDTTDEQREALEQYASTSNEGDIGKDINDQLRSGEDPTGDEKATMDTIDQALAGSTANQDLVTYRGIPDGSLGDLQPGDVITDQGYVSTSMLQATGEYFAQPGGTLVEVHIPAGSNALSMDNAGIGNNLGESEVLLPHGSSFEVQSVSSVSGVTGGTYTHVVMALRGGGS